ncbi:unnamed protein product, partial [Mesorhabditis belari]|uniref:Uncharacterized protein n=1 Tax=Mesorhabditis belari TaxID=2138241 RepID=A0AAF3ERQ3_9BILA
MDVSSSENLPRAEPSLEESIKFCFNKSHLDARNSIAKKLIKRFQESSSEEKLEFCQNVPKILNSKSEEIEIIYDWTRTSVANNALVESQELNKIFEALIADDFRNQAKELIAAYLFSINYEKLDCSLWKNYR